MRCVRFSQTNWSIVQIKTNRSTVVYGTECFFFCVHVHLSQSVSTVVVVAFSSRNYVTKAKKIVLDVFFSVFCMSVCVCVCGSTKRSLLIRWHCMVQLGALWCRNTPCENARNFLFLLLKSYDKHKFGWIKRWILADFYIFVVMWSFISSTVLENQKQHFCSNWIPHTIVVDFQSHDD